MQLANTGSAGFNLPRFIIDGVDDIYLIRRIGGIVILGMEVAFQESTSSWWLLIHCNIGGSDTLFRVKIVS